MIAACPLACVIRLTKGKIAIVDPWWWVTLKRGGWRAVLRTGGWYALKLTKENGKNKYEYMHRVINNTPKGEECHHKNKNTLDNREANLENLTPKKHGEIQSIRRIAKFRQPKPEAGTCDLPMK